MSVYSLHVPVHCVGFVKGANLARQCIFPLYFPAPAFFKPVAKPVPKKEYYKALYEFDPRNPDEMALEEGDIVLVSLFVFYFLARQGYHILHAC